MWWLAPIALIGAASTVWALFDRNARSARERWQDQRRSVQAAVEQHTRRIEKNLGTAEYCYDFYLLTELHYSSFRTADKAYRLLEDARTSLDVMGQMLVRAKSSRDAAWAAYRTTRDESRREELRREIEVCNSLRASIFPDKDAVKAQRDELLAEVRRLNARTRDLKLAIRDRCGARGRDWYDRLTQRTARRR